VCVIVCLEECRGVVRVLGLVGDCVGCCGWVWGGGGGGGGVWGVGGGGVVVGGVWGGGGGGGGGGWQIIVSRDHRQ